MVIMIHVTDEYLTNDVIGTDFLNSFEIGIILNSASRASVPLFLMITGSFLLDFGNEYNKRKATRYIRRVIKAFVCGTILYSIVEIVMGVLNVGLHGIGWGRILKDLITGPYHFWYLYLITGLYLITPILREIAKKDDILELYLLLSFTFSIVLPTICSFSALSKLELLINRVHLDFVTGYQFYFLFGYWLKKNRFQMKNKIGGILLYLSSVGICSILTILCNKESGRIVNECCLDYFFITTFLEAFSLFSLFSGVSICNGIKNIIKNISEATFGIYVLHVLFIKEYFGIHIVNWNVFGQSRLIVQSIIIFFVCLAAQLLYSTISINLKQKVRKE